MNKMREPSEVYINGITLKEMLGRPPINLSDYNLELVNLRGGTYET